MGLRLQGDPMTVDLRRRGGFRPRSRREPFRSRAGQLIVLGVACGTMGGYPHVAQLVSADLDRLGQLKPGDTLGFRLVSLEEARSLDRAAPGPRDIASSPYRHGRRWGLIGK